MCKFCFYHLKKTRQFTVSYNHAEENTLPMWNQVQDSMIPFEFVSSVGHLWYRIRLIKGNWSEQQTMQQLRKMEEQIEGVDKV